MSRVSTATSDGSPSRATHHPWIMPPSRFSDLGVETGGVGAGTVFHITLRVLGRRQRLHMAVTEPRPGTELTETDLDTGALTTFVAVFTIALCLPYSAGIVAPVFLVLLSVALLTTKAHR